MKLVLTRFSVLIFMILVNFLVGVGDSFADSSSASKSKQQVKTSKENVVRLKKYMEEHKTFDVGEFLQTEGGSESGLTINASNEENNLLYKIIKFLISVVGTLAILLYVVGAFFIMTHRGDSNQLQSGKRIIIYTSLGLAVAMLSYSIVQLVIGFVFDTAV